MNMKKIMAIGALVTLPTVGFAKMSKETLQNFVNLTSNTDSGKIYCKIKGNFNFTDDDSGLKSIGLQYYEKDHPYNDKTTHITHDKPIDLLKGIKDKDCSFYKSTVDIISHPFLCKLNSVDEMIKAEKLVDINGLYKIGYINDGDSYNHTIRKFIFSKHENALTVDDFSWCHFPTKSE